MTTTPAADSTWSQQAPQLSAESAQPARLWTTVLDGERLRQLRRQHGLSQEKLADRPG